MAGAAKVNIAGALWAQVSSLSMLGNFGGALAAHAVRLASNGTPILDQARFQRLSCSDLPHWKAFQHSVEGALQAGEALGRHHRLVELAEQLLAPYDQDPQANFQIRLQEFHAQLTGKTNASVSDGFCFPGYQTACFVRVARAADAVASEPEEGERAHFREIVEANAQYCASLFGKEGALDFLSSTGWPVSVLDFEIHMRSCPDASFTSRLAPALPAVVETYSQFRQHVARPGLAARLSTGSVDPQRISRTSGIPASLPFPRRVRLVSVDGGHCSLWLEPAITLRALFPGQVSSQLVSFKDNADCVRTLGPEVFSQEDLILNHEYFRSSPVFRSADILACQWVGECAKLRVAYSKPVIGYIGFLLLNDPSVGGYHKWSEPLPRYWERFKMLVECEVFTSSRARVQPATHPQPARRPPPDGGPPCALVWEEPQLAEAAHWQTGVQLPSVRPLALYVRARHRAGVASRSVLVVNRGRLARDVLFTQAANAMKDPDFPFGFVDQSAGMPYAEMAEHRSAVMLPWDLNLVMFHDLYAMEVPLHLPDRAGMHHTAFAYFSRFRKNSQFATQPWSEVRPGQSASTPHPYSPFALEFFEPREYWLGFTEYLRVPHVLHFSSVPALLEQVLRLDGSVVASRMHRYNLLCRRESQVFWGRVLTAFEQLRLEQHRPRPVPTLHFVTTYDRNLCWRGGLPQEDCCNATHGPGGNSACFDDFWTYQRCCVQSLRLPSLDDDTCSAAATTQRPAWEGTSVWESPLDGRPWIHHSPSTREPFVFLWDEKCGGTTFMTWLKYSVWRLGKLRSSFMYTTPGHPVAVGSPFFLKTFSSEQRRELEVVAGHLDWRVLHEGIDCRTRDRTRCFLVVRHPVDRFISYYLERSDRRFEREFTGNRSIESWTAAELRRYLDSIVRSRMRLAGDETGLLCNSENLMCLDRWRTRSAGYPPLRQLRPSAARERRYFRYLGGPQDRLAWLLDPENGDHRLATWRMRKCVVSLQAEDFAGHRSILGWHFPWIYEVRRPPSNLSTGAEAVLGRVNQRSELVRRAMPQFARDLIAEFNWRDMRIYHAAKRQHRKQIRRIKAEEASGAEERLPPVEHATEEEVQELVGSELRETATYKNHEGLNRYMLGI